MLTLRFILVQLTDVLKSIRRTPRAQVTVVLLAATGTLAMVTLGRTLLASAVVGARITPSGLLLELCVALCVLGFVYLGSIVHTLLGILPAAFYAAWFTANMEMAAAMDTVVDIRDVTYMADLVFLRSTGAGLTFPVFAYVFLLMCTGFAISTALLPRRPAARLHLLSAALVILVFGGAIIAVPQAMTWHEDSLVARSLDVSLHRAIGNDASDYGEQAPSESSSGAVEERAPESSPEANTSVSGALEAPLLFPRAEANARNVLMVVLEGIPGVYLRQVQEATGVTHPVVMEGLSRIADGGLTLSQSVAHSRQTIRGLYPALTGDYPRLDMSTPKIYPYIEAAQEHQPRGLPHALTQIGYHTVYMQAADLTFMSKDRFMPEVGFEEVIGSEHFDSQYVPFDWGPDDRAYFEQAADYIDNTLEGGERPWFLTLLTVGTHHPYGVTDGFASEYPNRKAAAVAYLDEALEEFMARLEADGVLEDTAVFFVADESHGFGRHPFGRYWGTTVVRVPETDEHVMQEEIFGLIDIPVTVLDYLGDDSLAGGFPGRSALREYASPRTLHFGPFISHGASGGHGVFERLRRNEYAVHSPVGDGLFAADYERSGDLSAWVRAAGTDTATAELTQRLEQSYERANEFNAVHISTGGNDSAPGQRRAHTWSLIEDTEYTLRPSQETVLSSAQYFEFDAGAVFTIHLDMEVEATAEDEAPSQGEATAEIDNPSEVEGPSEVEDTANDIENSEVLRPSLQMLSEYEPVELDLPAMPAMSAGETFELEVSVPVTRELTRVWFDLRVYSLSDDREVTVRVRDFSLELQDPLPPVAHAGGTYRGQTYTNSVEALEHNADDYRMFEIDFRWTSDGTLAGIHDWDSVFERLYGFEPAQPLSLPELNDVAAAANLTPATLESIRSFLSENPGASIVTDVKRDNLRALERIAEEIPDYAQRIIPQLYDPDEFERAVELGFERVIWTLYRFPGMRDTDLIARYVRDFEQQNPDTLFAVTIPSDIAHESTFDGIARMGVPIYAYTVDSCEELRELRSHGISSMYTDELGPECEQQ